jgi:hypothetical protein
VRSILALSELEAHLLVLAALGGTQMARDGMELVRAWINTDIVLEFRYIKRVLVSFWSVLELEFVWNWHVWNWHVWNWTFGGSDIVWRWSSGSF